MNAKDYRAAREYASAEGRTKDFDSAVYETLQDVAPPGITRKATQLSQEIAGRGLGRNTALEILFAIGLLLEEDERSVE